MQPGHNLLHTRRRRTGGVSPLVAPTNLFTSAQSDFEDTSHIDLRSNWTASEGNLQQTVGNSNTNDVRISTPTPLTSGEAHFMTWKTTGHSAADYRARFGGDGNLQAEKITPSQNFPKFFYASSGDMVGDYLRVEFKPLADTLDAQFTEVQLFNLAATDPNIVAADVVLVLGNSNLTPNVSDDVTETNNTTPFNTAVWTMPCLRVSPNEYDNAQAARHVAQPCIEPVQASAGAGRISPLQAFGNDFASYVKDRGRPLLLASLGDAGSGLNGTEDWRKTSSVSTTGNRMYDEMVAMVTAINNMTPNHRFIAAICQMGENDTTGADYDVTWVPQAQQFIADVRAESGIGNSNLPMVWMTPGEHYEPVGGEDRGARMIAAIESLDKDSGHANSVANIKAIRPPTGNQLNGATDPHFNAAGMIANGKAYASALRTLLG